MARGKKKESALTQEEKLAQVLVMEDDVVFDESVFECPFAVQKVSVLCILDPETSSVIMCFSDVQEFPVDAEVLGDEFRDEAEKVLYVYV